MKLSRNALCPIHRRRDCCGREKALLRTGKSKWETVRPGWRRIKDEHARHPDGYRYKLSPAAMRKVLTQKVHEQNGLCPLCGEVFVFAADIDPDHIEPRGMGGAWRDDRPDNIQAVHRKCNFEKGSKRI